MLKTELLEKADAVYLQDRAALYLLNKKAWVALVEALAQYRNRQ